MSATPSTSMAEPKPRRWLREEYHRMAAAGLFDGQRVELIDGEVVQISPHGDEHALSIMLADDALRSAFGQGYVVRVQLPIVVGDNSEPEPDLAVIAGRPRQITRHPTSALLIVEISDATVRFDLGSKASLYASCKVPDYWVVDLLRQQVVVHRAPIADRSAEFGHRYTNVQSFEANAVLSPLAKPDARITVADLLP